MSLSPQGNLSDPQVKAYLLELLSSPLSAEEKYQKLLDLITPAETGGGSLHVVEGPDGFRLPEMFASQSEPFTFTTDELVELCDQVAGSIRAALQRLRISQHQDGGWGPQVETSSFWHSAHAVRCLIAALGSRDLCAGLDVGSMLLRGVAYLEAQPESWIASVIPSEGALSVYDLCLMAQIFFHGGRDFLRRETAVSIYRSIEHLAHAQNEDGGWDASLWGYAVATPTRVFSEVGATAYALRTLAEVYDERYLVHIHQAARWLASTQNLDGSWNNGACRPDLPPLFLTGDPRVGKTCDAVKALLAAQSACQASERPAEGYGAIQAQAMAWLLQRTRPALEKHLHPAGWAWGYTAEDYENVCLVLETLLFIPDAPLPQLSAHARWLVQGQHRMPGDVEDGAWVLGHTARIAAALIGYYQRAGALVRSVSTYQQWLP